MAAEKSHPKPFTTRDGAAEAAAVRLTLERQQKALANTNLLHLRSMIDVSHDEKMADSLLMHIADEEHPNWGVYDPLMRTERIHRYPLDSTHATLLPMVTTIYASVAEYMRHAIEAREFPATIEEALADLVDVSSSALVRSDRCWPFSHPAYPTLQFAAHQLLLADSHNVKLFFIVVNGVVPYDYFFYFF